jgi:DNA-binding SARP family transcriptional activator
MNPAPLTISLFGPFEVSVRGQPLRRLRSRSLEWLLAWLVLRHGRPVSRAVLAGTLWPDTAHEPALRNLRTGLLDLRRALGPEAARLGSPTRDSLQLDLADAAVDLLRFDAATGMGDEASLQEAVALYRGELLEGCHEEWIVGERAARQEACLLALEKLADQALARGEAAAARAAGPRPGRLPGPDHRAKPGPGGGGVRGGLGRGAHAAAAGGDHLRPRGRL